MTMQISIGPVQFHNPERGYQIHVSREGKTILLTASHPVTGETLDFDACLDVALMYRSAGSTV